MSFVTNQLIVCYMYLPGHGRGGGRSGFESSTNNGWDDDGEAQNGKPSYGYTRGGRGGYSEDSYRSNGGREQVSSQFYYHGCLARPVIFLC